MKHEMDDHIPTSKALINQVVQIVRNIEGTKTKVQGEIRCPLCQKALRYSVDEKGRVKASCLGGEIDF